MSGASIWCDSRLSVFNHSARDNVVLVDQRPRCTYVAHAVFFGLFVGYRRPRVFCHFQSARAASTCYRIDRGHHVLPLSTHNRVNIHEAQRTQRLRNVATIVFNFNFLCWYGGIMTPAPSLPSLNAAAAGNSVFEEKALIGPQHQWVGVSRIVIGWSEHYLRVD